MYRKILIVLVAFIFAGCSGGIDKYYEEQADYVQGIEPPGPRVHPTLKQESNVNTAGYEKDTVSLENVPIEDVPLEKEVNFFEPGTFVFSYLYDVRDQKTISVKAVNNKQDVTIQIDAQGNMVIKDHTSTTYNLSVPVSDEKIVITNPTTIYAYQAFWMPPDLLPEVQSKWYECKLYTFKGKIQAIRIGPTIFAKDVVGIKFVNETDTYNDPPEGRRVYIVKRGDTLAKIARHFNVTVEELMKINSLTSTKIVPGQKIRAW